MITETSLERVYLARGATDLRKSIDGLAVLVKEGFQMDPFSPCLFVFCNRKHDKLKILHWEHNGFWLTTGDWRKVSFNDRKMMVRISAASGHPFRNIRTVFRNYPDSIMS